MKGFIKSTVVGLIVFAVSFSPAFAGLVNAGGIHFEGISATDSRHQAKGIMFDFSFGGPDDYKKKSAFKEVYKNNFAGVDWLILGAGILTVAALAYNQDDACVSYFANNNGPRFTLRHDGNGVVPPGYCESGQPYPNT
jgi:hypothetical protein